MQRDVQTAVCFAGLASNGQPRAGMEPFGRRQVVPGLVAPSSLRLDAGGWRARALVEELIWAGICCRA